MPEQITLQNTIKAPVTKVWQYYTQPEHVMVWNHASEDWICPRAENNLTVGEKFNYRMESTDGSQGFDFEGTYDEVVPMQKISYHMSDGRKVETLFEQRENETFVTVTFDAETENSIEMQRSGWQAIFDNFKKHVEQDV